MIDTISKLTELRNKFEARRESIGQEASEIIKNLENKIQEYSERLAETNEEIFRLEVMNLINGVTDRFYEREYYTPAKVYSHIRGVKNIRFSGDGKIEVKLTSPAGYLLPERINVFDEYYDVVFCESKNYSEEMNY